MSNANATTVAAAFSAGAVTVLALTLVSPALGVLAALASAAALGVAVRRNVDADASLPVTFIGQ